MKQKESYFLSRQHCFIYICRTSRII